jgi:hypothetical protein
MKLPDLAAHGFRFIRAQLLQYGEKPIAQMVYLPADRGPLALYATEGEGRSIPVFKQEGAIGTVSWSDEGVAYLLAGDKDKALLMRLADAIRHEPTAPAPSPPPQPASSQVKPEPAPSPPYSPLPQPLADPAPPLTASGPVQAISPEHAPAPSPN